MVNAIRYWGLAYKVLELRPNPGRRRLPLILPTEFGQTLLADGGWEPLPGRPCQPLAAALEASFTSMHGPYLAQDSGTPHEGSSSCR